MMKQKPETKKAVIYCRVSSDRQVREGDGLKSQETRCREFARIKGYEVVRVFKDGAVSGSVGPDKRPATQELFQFLDTQRDRFYIIIDDLSRVARSMEAHVEFQAKLMARGAILTSPTQEFETTSQGKLVTNLLASVNSYQRDANIEQVKNRQHARLQNGYWVFHQPPGYTFVKDVRGGKILAKDEPIASAIAEAFEGFAAGRFETQADVAFFLNSTGAFPSKVHLSRIKSILTCILYAGYIEYPAWGIERREGAHMPIISLTTFLRVQERLGGKAKAPYRKDLDAAFPLRGFVTCSCCGEPLTSGHSTGRSKKYAYYHCKKKDCALYGKSLKRDLVEGEMEGLLKSMRPSPLILDLLRDIVQDCWERKKQQYDQQLSAYGQESRKIDKEIKVFLTRCVEAEDPAVVKAYENHIKELKNRQDLINACVIEMDKVDTSRDGALGTVFDFISDPYSMWANGDLEDRRLVLKIAFAGRLAFDKEKGFGTAGKSLPFRVLEGLHPVKSKMVVYST